MPYKRPLRFCHYPPWQSIEYCHAPHQLHQAAHLQAELCLLGWVIHLPQTILVGIHGVSACIRLPSSTFHSWIGNGCLQIGSRPETNLWLHVTALLFAGSALVLELPSRPSPEPPTLLASSVRRFLSVGFFQLPQVFVFQALQQLPRPFLAEQHRLRYFEFLPKRLGPQVVQQIVPCPTTQLRK